MNDKVTENKPYRLAACWEPQDAMLLVWPSQDEIAISEDIVELYEALVTVLVDYADVILIAAANEFDAIKERLVLMEVPIEYVYFYDVASTSINVREYGPFVVESENQFTLWAKKKSFSEILYTQKALPCAVLENQAVQLSLNDIESDGGENLLVNLQQLRERNPDLSVASIKEFVQDKIYNNNIIWVDHQLTDTNIVRLCPDNKLVYLDCDEINSSYYEPIQNLKHNLIQRIETIEKNIELISLPWAGIITNDDGVEYLANYSQFVVINEAVLVPLFDLPSDEDAMEVISQIFPGFDILGFPSSSLAILKTSLLKVTQSIPEGVLEPL